MYNFRKWLKTALCAGAVSLLAGIPVFAGEWSDDPDRFAETLKKEDFPELFNNKDFMYYKAEIVNVFLKKNGKNKFNGVIEFRRNGKISKRPFSVEYAEKTGQYIYGMEFDYSKYPKFTEEDADLFFNAAQEMCEVLKSWRFVSGKNIAPATVRCTIVKGNESRTVDVKRMLVKKISGLHQFEAQIVDSTIPVLQFVLGVLYVEGDKEKGFPKDTQKALSLLTRAAEQGNGDAMFALGVLYLEGDKEKGFSQDTQKALSLITGAAEQGHVEAMSALGASYMDGTFSKDYTKAFFWINKAAEAGDVEAIYNLGLLYSNGWGCKADEEKAVELMKRAAKMKYKPAIDLLKENNISF